MPTPSTSSTLLDGKTGRRGLYALPMGRYSNHVHVWNSLLERAGFTLADIPKEWEAFWSFWCDQVQPAVRKALGRDDIWGVGLPMSAAARRHRRRAPAVPARLWHALARPRPPASGRRSRGAGGDHQGAERLHGDLAQGLHAARLGELDQHRQQQGVPRPDRGDDGEHVALDPGRAAHRAARRLLQERRHHRLARRRQRPAARHRWCHLSAPWSSRPAGTRRSPRTSSASSPRKAGSPTGWISPATASCRRCASWSSSRSGSTRATRTACARRSRS